jgi:hypothetical protein
MKISGYVSTVNPERRTAQPGPNIDKNAFGGNLFSWKEYEPEGEIGERRNA